MGIRVTPGMMYDKQLRQIQISQATLGKVQEQVATGKRINRPSDDPSGIGRMLELDRQSNDVQALLENVGLIQTRVDTTDKALDGIGLTLRRMRDLALQAASGTMSLGDRQVVAAEVAQLKEQVRDSINARSGDQYLFAGTASAQPYPAPVNTYAGSPNLPTRRLMPGVQVTVGINGDQVLGTTTGPLPTQMNVLDLADWMVSAMTSGVPSDLEDLRTLGVQSISAHIDNVISARASVGSVAARVQRAMEDMYLRQEDLLAERSEIADVDMAEAIMFMQRETGRYEATLAAGARLLNNSNILDWLR